MVDDQNKDRADDGRGYLYFADAQPPDLQAVRRGFDQHPDIDVFSERIRRQRRRRGDGAQQAEAAGHDPGFEERCRGKGGCEGGVDLALIGIDDGDLAVGNVPRIVLCEECLGRIDVLDVDLRSLGDQRIVFQPIPGDDRGCEYPDDDQPEENTDNDHDKRI